MGEIPEQLKPYAFTTENQPERRGRKPSVLIAVGDITGKHWKIHLKRQQKIEIYEAMLERTPNELREILADEDLPSFLHAVAQSILNDIKNGSFSTTEIIFDRAFGKPKISVDNNLSGKLDYTLHLDKPLTGESPDGAGSSL